SRRNELFAGTPKSLVHAALARRDRARSACPCHLKIVRLAKTARMPIRERLSRSCVITRCIGRYSEFSIYSPTAAADFVACPDTPKVSSIALERERRILRLCQLPLPLYDLAQGRSAF